MGNGVYYYLTTKGQSSDVKDKKQSCRNIDKQGKVTVS